ncbi:MAG: Gx transporter family protein [Clostridiales bacterium]|nr:Gx transporter family protein [Clostridiales bacterium]
MSRSKKIAYFGLSIALAFVLSYFESMIPFNFGIPGIKLGLANLVVVVALYTAPKRDAFIISMIRILLSGLIFSGAFSLLYSFAGGILSFVVMLLFQKSGRVSIFGVSVMGASVHNIGQIIVAAIVMKNTGVFYYLPVLLVSGAVTGALIGILSRIIIKTVRNYRSNEK